MLADVVVVGGGIVGSSCTYYLTAAGVRVLLLERGSLASGTSGAGEASLVPPLQPGIQAHLARLSGQLYHALSEELPLDIEYRQGGTLYLAETEEDWTSAVGTAQRLHASGEECLLLDCGEIRALAPTMCHSVAGGAFYPAGAQANPFAIVAGLTQAARARGAQVVTGTSVTALESDQTGTRIAAVRTASERIPTGNVVIAAGAWSSQVGAMLGICIPVVPRKGHIAVTESVAPILRCTTISELAYLRAAQGGNQELTVTLEMEQTPSGNLLLGMSREFVGFDRTVNPYVIRAIADRNLFYFPHNRNISIIRTYAGLRPYSPDHLPIIAPVPEIQGLFVATGHEGEGISLAPATGRLIQQLVTGQSPSLPIEELSLTRFISRSKQSEAHRKRHVGSRFSQPTAA
jgi:D-hydroxyproline dehydrogenase subunit beta